MITLPAGTFTMGSTDGSDDEQPVLPIRIETFALDRSPVTVAQFRQFVLRTGHATTAEKFGDSAVFFMERGRWQMVSGAQWRYPMGPDEAAAQPDHPVTQVSWSDAQAYCQAQDKRLVTEAEWEYAARNASSSAARYGFGDQIVRDGVFLANVFSGRFPFANDGADGYRYTSPVGAYGTTPLGLTDMAGNVWEWVADWYAPYSKRALALAAEGGAFSEKVQRGGSFLCAAEVCHGYRTTARGHSTPDSSHVHVGFRCARDLAASAAPGAKSAAVQPRPIDPAAPAQG
ncbi:MAG: formylglycine-generating enzyme family protein [Pseudomonadales bacterium]